VSLPLWWVGRDAGSGNGGSIRCGVIARVALAAAQRMWPPRRTWPVWPAGAGRRRGPLRDRWSASNHGLWASSRSPNRSTGIRTVAGWRATNLTDFAKDRAPSYVFRRPAWRAGPAGDRRGGSPARWPRTGCPSATPLRSNRRRLSWATGAAADRGPRSTGCACAATSTAPRESLKLTAASAVFMRCDAGTARRRRGSMLPECLRTRRGRPMRWSRHGFREAGLGASL
jgi:hypothetical protein